MIILIDNGHGADTPGKCSPDKSLREWQWTREIATRIVSKLNESGIYASRIVPEEKDVPLRERCRRVNNVCKKYGTDNVILISVHVNAARSDKRWHDASGWSGWVAPNASDASKKFAAVLFNEAEKRNLQGNRFVPVGKYWVGNYAIVRDTNCPAVLTENLFMDNKDEVTWLLSEAGKESIVNLHVDAIHRYLNAL